MDKTVKPNITEPTPTEKEAQESKTKFDFADTTTESETTQQAENNSNNKTEELSLVEKDNNTSIVIDRRAGAILDAKYRHELDVEDRKFRYWTMKVLIGCFCLVFVIFMLAVVYSMTFQQKAINDSTIKTFLDTLTEILRVLKPPSNPVPNG